jgi:hypothetical protein
MLSFDGGTCEMGTVTANGTSLGLELRWIEPTTLQVSHPESVALESGPSGEYLQCGSRKVRITLSSRRREANNPLVPTRNGEAPLLAAQRRRWAV